MIEIQFVEGVFEELKIPKNVGKLMALTGKSMPTIMRNLKDPQKIDLEMLVAISFVLNQPIEKLFKYEIG